MAKDIEQIKNALEVGFKKLQETEVFKELKNKMGFDAKLGGSCTNMFENSIPYTKGGVWIVEWCDAAYNSDTRGGLFIAYFQIGNLDHSEPQKRKDMRIFGLDNWYSHVQIDVLDGIHDDGEFDSYLYDRLQDESA